MQPFPALASSCLTYTHPSTSPAEVQLVPRTFYRVLLLQLQPQGLTPRNLQLQPTPTSAPCLSGACSWDYLRLIPLKLQLQLAFEGGPSAGNLHVSHAPSSSSQPAKDTQLTESGRRQLSHKVIPSIPEEIVVSPISQKQIHRDSQIRKQINMFQMKDQDKTPEKAK